VLINQTARILSATVRRQAGRWHVSFTCQVERAERSPARPDAVIGVDLGLTRLAVFSDGRPPVGNPRHSDAAQRKLRRTCRAVSRKQGPDHRTGRRPSNRWLRADAARNRVHHTYLCEHCGLIIDRDENAALNLGALVKHHVAGSGPETLNGRGADRETPPGGAGGCEASTPHQAAAWARRGPSSSNGRIIDTCVNG
jgi:transposase